MESKKHIAEHKCLKKSSFTSEYQFQFKNNCYSSYNSNFEQAVPHGRTIVSKELYERGNNMLPDHIPIESTHRREFRSSNHSEPLCRAPARKLEYTSPKRFSSEIDPDSPNYQKYLDIYATTNTLDFRNHKEVLHDAITVWDWLKIPRTRGRSLDIDIPICKPDFETKIQFKRPKCNDFIPHRGLMSEQQEEFSYNSIKDPIMPDE